MEKEQKQKRKTKQDRRSIPKTNESNEVMKIDKWALR